MRPNYQYDPVTGQPVGVPVPGQAFIQQGMNFVGKVTGDPFVGVKNLRFSQQPDWLECFCPCFCERQNQYQLTATDPFGIAELFQLGFIQEESECGGRFCCQCWRPMSLKFMNVQQDVIFTAKREYKLPAVFCLPCARPELVVSQNNSIIGFIKQPYMCCGRSPCPCPLLEEIDVCDEQGNMRYYISGQFCQCGFMARLYICPRCCGPCQFINFDIYSPTKEKVGQIRNIYNGCCNEVYTKADKFVIDFPSNADFRDKILLMNAVLTIDYDIFEYTFFNLP